MHRNLFQPLDNTADALWQRMDRRVRRATPFILCAAAAYFGLHVLAALLR